MVSMLFYPPSCYVLGIKEGLPGTEQLFRLGTCALKASRSENRCSGQLPLKNPASKAKCPSFISIIRNTCGKMHSTLFNDRFLDRKYYRSSLLDDLP